MHSGDKNYIQLRGFKDQWEKIHTAAGSHILCGGGLHVSKRKALRDLK